MVNEELLPPEVLAFIVVKGEPVPAGRPRFTRSGHAYDPQRSRDYKKLIKWSAGHQYDGELLHDRPLKVTIEIYREVQKSLSKRERQKRLSGEHRPLVKPDTSNYVKLIEDALTGTIWEDDNIIVQLVAQKFYSEVPRIVVTVTDAEAEG